MIYVFKGESYVFFLYSLFQYNPAYCISCLTYSVHIPYWPPFFGGCVSCRAGTPRWAKDISRRCSSGIGGLHFLRSAAESEYYAMILCSVLETLQTVSWVQDVGYVSGYVSRQVITHCIISSVCFYMLQIFIDSRTAKSILFFEKFSLCIYATIWESAWLWVLCESAGSLGPK